MGGVEDAGAMSNSREDVSGPALDTTVDQSSGLPAAHQEHGPARTDATAAGRDLARYGLGPKDVDDTDD